MKRHTKVISILAATALGVVFASCTDTGTTGSAGAGAAAGDETTASTTRGEGRAKGTKGMTSQRGELTEGSPAPSETTTKGR